MAEDNPSVVNDASGSNYNIGSGGSMGEAQMQYIENLQKLAMKMPPKPLSADQYMPGEAQGIQQGQVSGSIIGSQPLFAASNLIPFGMMDEMKRSQAEAEAAYYAKLKPYLDKPLIDAKLKLNNVWAQPEFASKLQNLSDKVVDTYASKFGGNYMMAHIAASQDKNFNRTLQRAGEYANIYNEVSGEAISTLTKANDPVNYYVSPEHVKAISDFIHAHDSLDTLTVDELAKRADEYKAKDSIFKLADAATAHIKDDIIESYSKSPMMSTDQEDVWVKTKQSGTQGQAEDIFNNIVKANPWLKDDETQRNLLKTEIEGNVKFGVEKSIEKIKANDADQKLALKKMGVDVQDDGSIIFKSTRTALINGVGANAVSFPNDKPMPSATGMDGYMLIKGSIRHVKADQSFQMVPKAEYDIGNESAKNIPPARYAEINVDLKSTTPYDAQHFSSVKGVPIVVGDPKGMTQTEEAALTDVDTGEVYKIMGNQTMLVPSNQLDRTIEANYPGMDYVHKALDEQSGMYPYSRDREFAGRSIDKPIVLPEGADLSIVRDDPGIFYRNSKGKVASGAAIHDIVRKQK